jgi:endonuclease YncB( thermonuclease family)
VRLRFLIAVPVVSALVVTLLTVSPLAARAPHLHSASSVDSHQRTATGAGHLRHRVAHFRHHAAYRTSVHPVLTGKVVSVQSGDSLTIVDQSNTQHRVHLYGTEAPLKGQPFANESRQSLTTKTLDKTVRVKAMHAERNGAISGKVAVSGGTHYVNLQQVREGMAWHHLGGGHNTKLAVAEAKAKNARRGLWSEANPVAPWRFRQQQRVGIATP